jgi:hypothetical protein
MATKLTKNQEAFLRDLGVGREVSLTFAQRAMVGVLRRKGLIHTRSLVGKTNVWAQPTDEGHILLRLTAANRARSHATVKTPAQLDREIAESLCKEGRLTADTITDEQIRELRAYEHKLASTSTGVARVIAQTAVADADLALSGRGVANARKRKARARCAQILNARSKSV